MLERKRIGQNRLEKCYFNPFPDEQLILDGHRAKTSLPFQFTFYILFRMQKRSAGEQLAGWSFCILNDIYKVNYNGKLVRFGGVLKSCLSVNPFPVEQLILDGHLVKTN